MSRRTKQVRRKRCVWCSEMLPRTAFGDDVRLGSKPGAFCKECVRLMDAYKELRRRAGQLPKR